MRSRLARLGLLTVAVLALPVVTTAPPAQAHMDSVVTFTGITTADGGLDYACVDFNKPCPPTPTTVLDLPLQDDPIPLNTNTHVEWSGNRRGFGISSTICTMEGVQSPRQDPPPKPGGPFVHTCSFGTAQNPSGKPNYVQGHCESAGGQAFVVINDALGQTYEADVHFSGGFTGAASSGHIQLTGHWRKRSDPSRHGKIVGDLRASQAGLEPTPTNSCLNKTASIFNFSGTATLIQNPTLLSLP